MADAHLHAALLVHEALVHVLRDDEFGAQLGRLVASAAAAQREDGAATVLFARLFNRLHLTQLL